MTTHEFALRLQHACASVMAAEQELTEIDSKFGDADHGLTMTKIAKAISAAVEASDGGIQTMLDDAQDRVDAMNDIDKSGTVEAVASIRTFYDSVVDTLSDLIDQNTQVNMSSGIKEAYMEIMVNRKTMITSFE